MFNSRRDIPKMATRHTRSLFPTGPRERDPGLTTRAATAAARVVLSTRSADPVAIRSWARDVEQRVRLLL